MSAVAAAGAAVVRSKLLAGEQITILVGAALGPGGTLKVFAVMALSTQHTFQVLTKRAARMRAYLTQERCDAVDAEALKIDRTQKQWPVPNWPLPNVWLGVSAERQKEAEERIPDLLATPAVVRFVSAEPLLGKVDFVHACYKAQGFKEGAWEAAQGLDLLHWIIVGGESGPGARPMHPDWVRSIRDQCAAAGTAFFFKQWGGWAQFLPEGAEWKRRDEWMILDRKGALDIPDDCWPNEAEGEVAVIEVGKKAAGRMLDGVEHSAFPQVAG